MMFANLIGKAMEVYIDDMLVKNLKTVDHVNQLKNTFQILRKYNMKLNPLKCTFGIASGQFLGYIVNYRGMEANLEKIRAMLEMRSSQKLKEVQCLNAPIATLSCPISIAIDKSLPFFKILKEGKKFQWTEDCEVAFYALKKHLGEVPLLSKPKPHKPLLLYLAVLEEVINAVLNREEGTRQLPVYCISKALLLVEARY